MNRTLRFVIGVFACLAVVDVAEAATTQCLASSSSSWQSAAIAPQTGKFILSYDAVPQTSFMDGITGFSAAPATSYGDLALITRFNTGGFIDARNGGTYQANVSIPYTVGATYRFRLVVDVSNHRYDVYVTPPGSSERTVGLGYAFRTEQANATRIGYENAYASIGTHTVCNVSVSPSVCVSSDSSSWRSTPIVPQAGRFSVSYDAVPQANFIDGVTGFAAGPATSYADLAMIARFNTAGLIDARNAGVYQAVQPIPYSAGLTYHFRLVADVPNHKYDVYVTPPGSSERAVGLGYAFRTEQATVTSIVYEDAYASIGTHTVCNASVSGVSQYDSVVVGEKPVMYLTMGSPSAGSEPDRSGRGSNGTYVGGTPSIGTMPNGDKAAVFNGSSQYLTVPSDAALSIPTKQQLSWEAWIRPDTLLFPNATGSADRFIEWMGKCEQHHTNCEWEARMYRSDTTRPSRLSAYAFNLTTPAGATVFGSGADWQPNDNVINAGQWLHVVGEYQTSVTPSRCSSTYPGSIDIWVNGIKWNFTTHGDTGCMSQYKVAPKASNSPLNVGTMSLDAWFKGGIGKVAVYNYLLSQTQINSHYSAMTGIQPSGSCADKCTTP